MAVDQDDFVGLGPGAHLPGVAHADHVFGELGLSFDTAFALGHHEGLEAYLAQTAQHVDGGDVGVALGTAPVFAFGKDGRRGPAHLVFGQRRFAADHKSVLAKAGGQGAGSLNGVHGDAPENRHAKG